MESFIGLMALQLNLKTEKNGLIFTEHLKICNKN
jgi:hypothetical protein